MAFALMRSGKEWIKADRSAASVAHGASEGLSLMKAFFTGARRAQEKISATFSRLLR
jgi:hypothetical protein